MAFELPPEKKRIVVIGGYSQGKTTVDNIAAAIETYHHKDTIATIDPFTCSSALKNPSILRRAIQKAEVATLSLGFKALIDAMDNREDSRPYTIDAFNPPIPTSIPSLIGRTGIKSWEMLKDTDKLAAQSYNRSSAAEFVAHAPTLVRAFFDISKFDAIKEARDLREREIPIDLAYTNNDRYFTLTEEQKAFAEEARVRIFLLDGVHDELALRPDETFRLYMEAKAIETESL